VSCVPTPKTPSFFQQLIALINHQSVDIHGVWVMFFLGEVIFLLGGFLLFQGTPGLFNSSSKFVVLVIKRCCPFVPIVNGFEQHL
jgi:hypothetical protein